MLIEKIADPLGHVQLGWLTSQVLYARFEQYISAALGRHVANELGVLLGKRSGVRLFSDASRVRAYADAAGAAMAAATLSRRSQFEQVLSLPWRGTLSARAVALAKDFGNFVYATPEEFEAALLSAVPSPVLQKLRANVLGASAAGDGSTSGRRTYEFSLADFETGWFTAFRDARVSQLPRDGWLCLAASDAEAIELAQRAALLHWSLPRTRAPHEFTVRFVDATLPIP